MTFMSHKTASTDVRSKLHPQQTPGTAAGATAQVHHKRAESAWTMASLKKKKDTTKGKAVDKPVTVPDSFEKAPNPMDTALKAPARQFEIIAPRASPTAAVFESEQVELPSIPRVKPKGLPKVRLVPPVEGECGPRIVRDLYTDLQQIQATVAHCTLLPPLQHPRLAWGVRAHMAVARSSTR